MQFLQPFVLDSNSLSLNPFLLETDMASGPCRSANQTRTGTGLRHGTLGAETVREVDSDVHTMTSLNEEKSTSLHYQTQNALGMI